MSANGKDGKSIAELDTEAIEKFNKKLKDSLDREAKMYRNFQWRGNKVMPFSIEPLPFPRQRLETPMTPEDRMLRKQWLLDQELAPNEPRYIPELYPRNPIRRFFGKPWDVFFNVLRPVLGPERASNGRFFVPKIAMAVVTCYAIYYHMKYNYNTWTDKHGWNIYGTKPPVYTRGVKVEAKELDDFYDRGFKNRKVLLSLKTSGPE